MPEMMKALREVLVESHEAKADSVIWADISGQVRKSENTIRRFEKGESSPPFEQVDQYVDGYAAALGIDPLWIWREALKRTEAASPAFDPDQAVAAAKAAADRAGRRAEAQQLSGRAPSRSTSRAPRRKSQK